MKKLILHADDFGLSESVSEGILECILKGAVTSTSLLVNFPSSPTALSWAKQHSLDVGWHLNLVQGRPLSRLEDVPSLVGKNGAFHSLPVLIQKCLLGRIQVDEVERELLAQVQVFSDSGIRPTHVDGHLHVHVFPIIREALFNVIKIHPIPFVRTPRERGGANIPRFPARLFLKLMKGSQPDFWARAGARSVPFYGLTLSPFAYDLKAWEGLLSRIEEDVAEVMVHPGRFNSEGERKKDDLGEKRERELQLFTNPAFRDFLLRKNFKLVSFRELIP